MPRCNARRDTRPHIAPTQLIRGAIALVALASGLAAGLSSTSAGAATSAASVTITRDPNGIPHITARNFGALGYGEGWAYSQDNFCLLAQDFVTVEGQRSKYFGPKAKSVDYAADVVTSNLDSDFFWTGIEDSGLITKLMHEAPPNGPSPQIRQLVQGYADGYNAYLASGQLNDPTCKGKAWLHPITANDVYLRILQVATESGSAQFMTDEADAEPPPVEATAPATPATPAAPQSLTAKAVPTLGSNGIGVGSQDTAAGDGMVLANPHFPWRGIDRFWMAQLTVPGVYDVEGGTLGGVPLIGIGFNKDLSWTHTVSTDERFTFYQLQLAPNDPTSYLVDGRTTKMGTENVRVATPGGTVRHTFYTTRWGTVAVVAQAGYKWTSTNAYTVDDATLQDPIRLANQYLAMGESTSVQGLLAVESKDLAIPVFNTIASDDKGDTLYADVGDTPDVPQSLINTCIPAGLPQAVYSEAGYITLDGSRSACAWVQAPGTPQPGIFPATSEPSEIRTDYVENSNDSYWLANPSAPFPAFSPIIGATGISQGVRMRQGNQMIAARVAGTDGLGAPKFTVATMEKMWEGDVSYGATLTLAPLVAACRATPSVQASDGKTVDLTPACDALAAYNGTGRLDAKGGWLFQEWWFDTPNDNFWGTDFNPADPLTTPSGIDTSNPALLQTLADVVEKLDARHIPLDASFGQVQYLELHGKKIPVPGCNSGCFNVVASADGQGGVLDANPYGEAYFGSSMVMVSELTAHGPVAQATLTYSEATNPKSPWTSNLTERYSKGQWVSLPYTAAQLAKDHGTRTTTLEVPATVPA